MRQTAKVTARGLISGKPTVIDVIRYGGGRDENDDWQDGDIVFFVNNVEISLKDAWRISRRSRLGDVKNHSDESAIAGSLVSSARQRFQKGIKDFPWAYNASFKSIEAYWLAFHYGDGFDEVPEISVEGELDTFGSPFSNEDTSGVVF